MEPKRVYEFRASVYRDGRDWLADGTLARVDDDVAYEGMGQGRTPESSVRRAFRDALLIMRESERAHR